MKPRLFAKVDRFCLALLLIPAMLLITDCRGRRGRGGKAKMAWRKSGQGNTSQKPTGPVSQVITTARSYIGTPHVLGGTTRAGIDCSALMVVSYNSISVTIPRTSTQQSQAGRAVGYGELKPGDLVFFTDRPGNSQVTHVGMITELAGDSNIRFIHTSSSLGVTENNLKQPYWAKLYLKAVRVI